MFEFEIIIVVVCLRSETDFLHNHLRRLEFHFLLALLLLVEELLIVNNLAYGRFGVWRNFNKVQTEVVRNAKRLCNRIDTLIDVLANETYFSCTDVIIDFVQLNFFYASPVRTAIVMWISDGLVLLKRLMNTMLVKKAHKYRDKIPNLVRFFIFFIERHQLSVSQH